MAGKHFQRNVQHPLPSEICKSKLLPRFHLTPVRVAKVNKASDSSCWRGCGARGTLCIAVGVRTCATILEIILEISQKTVPSQKESIKYSGSEGWG